MYTYARAHVRVRAYSIPTYTNILTLTYTNSQAITQTHTHVLTCVYIHAHTQKNTH